ncbi:MAG: hypothetical protein HY062_17885 [Bacteroidetes bacterium]|nr:hypothetical protein [Bacteroidota bacterium]
MKKLFLSFVTLFGLSAYSQNTIPTTTVTGALSVNDSLKVTRDIMANGDITSRGEVVSKDTMRALKDVIVDGNVIIGGKLKVDNNARFKDDVRLMKGFTYDGSNGLSYSVNNGVKLFDYGLKGGLKPNPRSCAAGPQPWSNHQFGGMLQIYDADATGQYVPNSGLLNFQTWSGGSSIDASIGGNLGGGGLLLNYFCHNNTFINTGWDLANNVNGGTVYMGAKVDMQNSLKIGWTQNGTIDLNTSIEINQNTNNANGVKVQTFNNTINAFSVLKSDGTNPFVVRGDGSTKTGNLNVKGDVTVSNLIGSGNRALMVDANGVLKVSSSLSSCVAGAPQWSVGGDNIGGLGYSDRSIGTCDNQDFILKANNIKRIIISTNGKMYFGATKIIASHAHSNSPYQFDGKVACKELVVVDPVKWADFVFEKSYNLLPLNEVESFYIENKHLPSVPSEAEVKENGINTATMDAILLQKIEELTLYIVQQKKEIDALKKEIKK